MNPLKPINNFILNLEKSKYIERTKGIIHNYRKDYPQFQELENNYEIIRKECEALLKIQDEIHNVQGMGGKKTVGGIHDIKWKSFMFKAGTFIEENCELCPETAKILKRTPRVKQAFFSILYPNQYIKPHRGYYHGFLRYHMGVIIPNNNKDNKCWVRVNDDPVDNMNYDKGSMHRGETYCWKNGEGIIFNDNYLHDASNESDEIRVILWLDVVRKFPFWLDWFNNLIMTLGYMTKPAKRLAREAKLNIPKSRLQPDNS